MTQFTQPVSMQVIKEQYNKDLKEPLGKLGYKGEEYVLFNDLDDFYIYTNFCKKNNNLAVIDKISANNANRYFIDHYNPELFLALAAMSNEQYGIAEEYWKFIDTDKTFTTNKLYKAISNIENDASVFIDDNGLQDGWYHNHKRFVKATKEELINLLTKKETVINKVDRTMSIKCANQEEFDIVVKWLTDNRECISIYCNTTDNKRCLVIFFNKTLNTWNSGHKDNPYDNTKTPQELGIILNTPLNKPTMQNSLTRLELLKLHCDFNCTTFRNAIEEILRSNVMAYDSTSFAIDEMHIKALIKEGTLPQKEAVSKLGIVLEEDKSVDTKNTLISSMIGNRDCGEYQNKAFYLSYEYNWEIKKDIQGLLCLIPTKK